MGRSRYKIKNPAVPHMLTCTVLQWLPVFTRPETVNILLESLRFLQRESFVIHAWVILENHMHMIARSDDLIRDITRFKSFTAKELLYFLVQRNAKILLDQFEANKKAHKTYRTYQFWQEGCHPEEILGEEMMLQKIRYIHENPVKRGYVDMPEHWRYSSARSYSGENWLIEIDRSW